MTGGEARDSAGRRGRPLRSLTAALFALLLPVPGAGQAILNVERLQSGEVHGLHGELAGRLSLSSGNTELFQVGAALGTGYRATRHWGRVYLGMEKLEKNHTEILDNRYLHLRYNYFFREGLRSFHFTQVQTNQNLLLRNRWLVGSGLRLKAFGGERQQLEVGSGLMYESETLRESGLDEGEDPETRTVRMSNLLVASWSPAAGSRLLALAYHQPDVRRFRDYRLLGELRLAVEIVRTLQLEVALDWRHDSRAPGDLAEDDLALKTGITYRIR